MSYYYPGTNTVDHTNRLGFAKMPSGYHLLQLDSGHFMWFHPDRDTDSCIHWDKWAVYRGAFMDAARRNSCSSST